MTISDRPMVNVYEGDPPELIYRPMNDNEYAQYQADQQEAIDNPPPPPPPTPTEVATQMATDINSAMSSLDPATATPADIITAIQNTMAPYLSTTPAAAATKK